MKSTLTAIVLIVSAGSASAAEAGATMVVKPSGAAICRRLLQAKMFAYLATKGEAGKAVRTPTCALLPAGTHVTFEDTDGNEFAAITILDGPAKGDSGWTMTRWLKQVK